MGVKEGVKMGVKEGVMRFAQDDRFAASIITAETIQSTIVTFFLTFKITAN